MSSSQGKRPFWRWATRKWNVEYVWDQTYTIVQAVGYGGGRVQVEHIIRDLFRSVAVNVRDIRMAVVFIADASEQVFRYVLHVHVVVRGTPVIGDIGEDFSIERRGIEQTHSRCWISLQADIREQYRRVFLLYQKPPEGIGVKYIYFRRDGDEVVHRTVISSTDGIEGYDHGEYVCEGEIKRPSKKRRGRRRWTVPVDGGAQSDCEIVGVRSASRDEFRQELSKYRYPDDEMVNAEQI